MKPKLPMGLAALCALQKNMFVVCDLCLSEITFSDALYFIWCPLFPSFWKGFILEGCFLFFTLQNDFRNFYGISEYTLIYHHSLNLTLWWAFMHVSILYLELGCWWTLFLCFKMRVYMLLDIRISVDHPAILLNACLPVLFKHLGFKVPILQIPCNWFQSAITFLLVIEPANVPSYLVSFS